MRAVIHECTVPETATVPASRRAPLPGRHSVDRSTQPIWHADPPASSGVLRTGASLLDVRGHVCAFFHTPDEEYRVLLPFIKRGFELGERAFHVVAPSRREEHVRRLIGAGIDVDAAESSGQLDLRDWTQAHLRGGEFDAANMIDVVAGARAYAEQHGFERTRYVTHMEWALTAGNLTERLAEYEANANRTIPARDDAVICVYHFPAWGGQSLVDAIRTHPLVIIGGYLHENPFFQPVAEFLGELRARRDGDDAEPRYEPDGAADGA